uniref:RNA-directed DNA polymerase, eukaryota, reverse transcriptase zinc-binding domain protein n=1 Tax=Tanacetum cinerariifolium TaxID=118510 RepID=A0A6L2JUA4_TANCI|nr:hypothetical protein [Tanacetum cinerariifolium]
MKLRDRIKDFVGCKVGNGKSCFIWYDKWHSIGSLCKLITNKLLSYYDFDDKDKIIDWIDNGRWSWPNDWIRRFREALDVHVPVLNKLDDKAIWYNKKNEVVNFNVKEACSAFRVDMPDVLCCDFAKIIWGRIKVMAKLDNLSNVWVEVVYGSRDVGIAANIWGLPRLGLKGTYGLIDDMDIHNVLYSLWWLEEYQDDKLMKDLVYCIVCIIWLQDYKKVQMSVLFISLVRFFLFGFTKGGFFKEANSFGWHYLCTSVYGYRFSWIWC